MAKLSNQEVQKLYQERPRKKEVEIGITHQDRLRFHTETVISKDKLSPYYRTYENWIISNKPELLPKDKAERFKQLLTVPLPTIELTESITSQLGNVFTAQDSFFRYDFTNPELEADWLEYQDT
jgi:rRNA pseudouridine-1189 N-methylase Emg1 (Nep1/Mra1 family)